MLVDLRPNDNPIRTPHPLGDDFGPDLPLLFKLHEIWLVAFLKIVKIVATTAKMHQIRFRLGLRPRPRWGSTQRSPRPPSWI